LYFSEPTQAGLSSIQVLDSRGNRVDAGDSRVDPADATHLTVSLGSLNNGVYTVAWTATSAADGHATTGSYPFAIGDAAALANAPKASQQAPLSPVEIILKGLLYLSGAALLGGLLFSQLVWQPSESIGNLLPAVQWRYRLGTQRLFLIALFLFEVASFAGIFAIAFQAGGFFSLYNLIFNTRAGCLVLARLGLGIGLAGLLFSRPAAWKTWGGLALGLLALLSISLGSHAVAEVHPVFPVLADWIHLSATSVWIGGLFFFLIALWSYRLLPPAQRTQRLSGMIPRFSNLALVSVGSLALTGLYEAILRVGTLQALVSTTYGQALILKTLIFLPIVGLGALNLLVITPRMQQAASQPEGNLQLTQRFNRSVTAEASLGIVILLWVGLFTSLPPAQTNSAPPGFNATTN
jgi:copper transport protein